MANDKMVTIIVEGTPHEVPKGKITYETVVKFFDPTYPQNPPDTYLVKYRKGPAKNPENTLSPGGDVEVVEGMVFNVSKTGQS